MHRCLQIPEILKAILEEVSERSTNYEWLSPTSTELRSYASMARTCKAFYEPSMDCLWEALLNLDPLAKCMPSVIVEAWSTSIEDQTYDIGSLVGSSAEDAAWLRFVANASRIKSLSVYQRPGLKKQLQAMRAYLKLGGSRSLLCNLRRLMIAGDLSVDDAEHIDTIMGSPHLKTFWMATWPSDGIVPVLEHLSKIHPEIPAIEIAAFDPGPQALHIMERFTHLEDFQSPSPLYPGLIAHFSSSRTLRKLHIKMPWEYLLELALDTSLSSPGNSFSALTDLRLHHIQHPDLLLLFMRTISSRALDSLDLLFDIPERRLVSCMDPLLELISTFTLLQKVTIGTLDSEEPGDDSPLYDIAPLKRLRQLRWLRLSLFGFREGIVDQAIPDLARAWPELDFLSYRQNIPCAIERTGLTLKALELFARHFPKLNALWLDLQVDATTIPPPLSTPIHTRDIILDFTWSLIHHETFADVAAYISSVTPSAYVYVNVEANGSAEALYWYHMQGILPVLARLRKDSCQGLLPVATSI